LSQSQGLPKVFEFFTRHFARSKDCHNFRHGSSDPGSPGAHIRLLQPFQSFFQAAGPQRARDDNRLNITQLPMPSRLLCYTNAIPTCNISV
jgi:hypothetical protein